MPYDDAPAWGPLFIRQILGWAEHPNAAQVLTNFLLAPEGQEAYMHRGIAALDEPVEATSDTVNDADTYERVLSADELRAHMDEWKRVFGR